MKIDAAQDNHEADSPAKEITFTQLLLATQIVQDELAGETKSYDAALREGDHAVEAACEAKIAHLKAVLESANTLLHSHDGLRFVPSLMTTASTLTTTTTTTTPTPANDETTHQTAASDKSSSHLISLCETIVDGKLTLESRSSLKVSTLSLSPARLEALCRELARAGSSLESLEINGCEIFDLDFMEELLSASTLSLPLMRKLFLHNNRISRLEGGFTRGLDANANRLQELYLSCNNIEDVSALGEVLRRNQGIRILRLGGNSIREAGPLARSLEENTTLEQLFLIDNKIEDVSSLAQALRKNFSLKVLALSGNCIADVSTLGEALRWNASLEELYLGGNKVVDVRSLGEGLGKNRALRKLLLYDNGIESLSPLLEGIRRNRVLTVCHVGGNPDYVEERAKGAFDAIWQDHLYEVEVRYPARRAAALVLFRGAHVPSTLSSSLMQQHYERRPGSTNAAEEIVITTRMVFSKKNALGRIAKFLGA